MNNTSLKIVFALISIINSSQVALAEQKSLSQLDFDGRSKSAQVLKISHDEEELLTLLDNDSVDSVGQDRDFEDDKWAELLRKSKKTKLDSSF